MKKEKDCFFKHKKWLKDDDQKLLDLIGLYGKDDRNFLSKKMLLIRLFL